MVQTLSRLGIVSTADLLAYYPRDWEDRSFTVPIANFRRYPAVNTIVRVLAHDWFGFGRMKTLKIYVEDESSPLGSGSLKENRTRAVLVCFNRPFLERQLPVGSHCRLWGKFFYKYGEIQSSAFEVELLRDEEQRREKSSPAPEPSPPGTAPRSPATPSTGGLPPVTPPVGAAPAGAILPVYRLTATLAQSRLRTIMRNALSQYAAALESELPEAIIRRDGLLPKALALRAIHFPASQTELDLARRTLIYEELFYLEVLVGKRALERRTAGAKPAFAPGALRGRQAPVSGVAEKRFAFAASGKRETFGAQGVWPPSASELSPLQQALLGRLTFSLTPGQVNAVDEINRDITGAYPMARLLQGDVGAGKTLVAFLACLRAVDAPPGEARGQAAIMAPTELLARQHAENAAALLEPLGLRIGFLTGNVKAKGRAHLLAALAEGAIDIAVGTHALFSRGTAYRNLTLVVVDEQHRFGVTQRQAIMAKGDKPHLLMMSATPIPRTLAFTVFGDLDVSVIPDLPPGRKPVKTHLAREGNDGRVYDFVRKELAAGHQAYFVYPLIGDDDNDDETGSPESEPRRPAAASGGRGGPPGPSGLKAAVSMAERLENQVFPEYPVALVHSRLDEEEKRRRMEAFRKGEVRILVATSVVEVGVDVPNATCMVIEHAERFGLAALHQLRGRVGRGAAQSYCFLIYSDESDAAGTGPELPGGGLTEDGKTRLRVMLETNDGFVIAEEDLKLRGPGHIAGTEQSGYVSLGLADPVRDAEELARARNDAFAMLEADPGLLLPEHQVVREVLSRAAPFSSVSL
jgi:ATP-dependent DNA helicase RecG